MINLYKKIDTIIFNDLFLGELDDLDDFEETDFFKYWRSMFKKVSVDDIKAFEENYVGMLVHSALFISKNDED